jgi:hypothetical protein
MMSLQQIARALDGEIAGNQVRAPGPGHSPKDRSLTVKLDNRGEIIVYSHAGDDVIRCKDYVREKCGLPAWRKNTVVREVVETYPYTDAAGELLFQVLRYTPKGFSQRRPDANGGWIWNLNEVRRDLYRLPDLIEAVGNEQPIFLAEGEKAVDALVKLGVSATCSPHGAGKWRHEYARHLKGANVIILPDNDEPGEAHARDVAGSLDGVAGSIKVLQLPDLPPGGDAYDWVAASGSVETLWKLVGAIEGPKALIISSGDFVAGYIAPQYLIEGIVQQKRIYSLTGKTGDGKTALQLYLASLIATGASLGQREVERCRVLYLAGENPDDVRARWLAMSDALNFDASTIPVHFVEGVFSVSGMLERVKAESDAIGGFGAVIVDTSAAYFEGAEENDNVQLGNWARLLRRLTELPGGPAVIVGCHPIKSGESLLPRGGGAFLAEVDGNLTCKKLSDEIIELHWSGKYRGASFDPVLFELVTITSERVKDAKGRLIASVMVRLTDNAKLDYIEERTAEYEDQMLVLLHTTPGMAQAKMAEALGWVSEYGPLKQKVNRALARLLSHRLAEKDRMGKYQLTEKGKKEAMRLKNTP